MIIALSGVDGSGKTTAAKLLAERLKNYGAKATYRHEFDFLIWSPIKGFLNKLIGTKRASELSDYTDLHLEQGTSIQKIIYLLIWLDRIISHLYFRLKRGIIVHDRWHYDHIAHLEYKPRKSAFLKKLYSTSPRADIMILLSVPPQVAYQRRKNDSLHPHWARNLQYYEAQVRLMLKIAKAFNYDKTLNSNKPPYEVLNDIIDFLRESRPEIMESALTCRCD